MKEMNVRLYPVDSRKSFYGKAALYRDDDGTVYLKSYETFVCSMTPDGKFHRLWGGYSATTMRHVNSFLAYCGLTGGGAAWWRKQETEECKYNRNFNYGWMLVYIA